MNEPSKLQTLQNELSELEKVLSEAQDRYNQTSKQRDALKKEKYSLNSALSRVKEELSSLQASYNSSIKNCNDEMKKIEGRKFLSWLLLIIWPPISSIFSILMFVSNKRKTKELEAKRVSIENDYLQNRSPLDEKEALLSEQIKCFDAKLNRIGGIYLAADQEVRQYEEKYSRVNNAIKEQIDRIHAEAEARRKAEEARIFAAKVEEYSEKAILASEGYRELIDYSVNVFDKVIKQQKPGTDERMIKAELTYWVQEYCVDYKYDEVEQKPSYSQKKKEPDQFVYSLNGKKNIVDEAERCGLAWALSTLIIKEISDLYPDGAVEAVRKDNQVLLKYSANNSDYVTPQNWV